MSKLGHIDIGPLDAREERLVATAIQQLSAIPTRGPAHAVFDALGTCAPVVGGLIGAMGTEMSGAAISHVVGLPTDVLEGWATTPLAHLRVMMAPLVPATPGELISDTSTITGPFREELELLRVLHTAGLGESGGYKVSARTTLSGKPEHRFLTFALDGGETFTPRQRALFRVLQPTVEATLARMEVPLVASEPIFAQIIEDRRIGYLCLSKQHTIVELNERAHELVFRYLEGAHVEAGRGCLQRFADKALVETAGGRAWQLYLHGGAAGVEITTHRLAKEMHHTGEDLTLVMLSETELVPPPHVLVRASVTERQLEVAHLLATTGLSYKEIADRLGIAEGTVRKHVEKVYRAFGVRSRPALAFKLR